MILVIALTVDVMHEQSTSRTETNHEEPDTLGRVMRVRRFSAISEKDTDTFSRSDFGLGCVSTLPVKLEMYASS